MGFPHVENRTLPSIDPTKDYFTKDHHQQQGGSNGASVPAAAASAADDDAGQVQGGEEKADGGKEDAAEVERQQAAERALIEAGIDNPKRGEILRKVPGITAAIIEDVFGACMSARNPPGLLASKLLSEGPRLVSLGSGKAPRGGAPTLPTGPLTIRT